MEDRIGNGRRDQGHRSRRISEHRPPDAAGELPALAAHRLHELRAATLVTQPRVPGLEASQESPGGHRPGGAPRGNEPGEACRAHGSRYGSARRDLRGQRTCSPGRTFRRHPRGHATPLSRPWGAEIDVIAEADDGRVVGVEIKSTASIRREHFAHLAAVRDRLDKLPDMKFVRGVVLYTGTGVHGFGDRLEALPLAALWLPPR